MRKRGGAEVWWVCTHRQRPFRDMEMTGLLFRQDPAHVSEATHRILDASLVPGYLTVLEKRDSVSKE